MKNKSLIKLTAIVLLATMVALVIISGTFAKYTNQYEGAGTAIVANWDVSVTDFDGTTTYTDDQTINLFDVTNVYDLKGVGEDNDVTSLTATDDEDVYNGTDKAIVAPGTWGKVGFVVKVGAMTDVTVKYSVDITELETNGIPLKFSVDGKTWKTATEIKATSLVDGKIVPPRTADSTTTVALYWKWDFEEKDENGNVIAANDISDTKLGEATVKKECTIKTKLVATQVD